jgi:hypothetical protein
VAQYFEEGYGSVRAVLPMMMVIVEEYGCETWSLMLSVRIVRCGEYLVLKDGMCEEENCIICILLRVLLE